MISESENLNYDSVLVSIIIPVFNREDFLHDTLRSVKNQTYKNWEAILVDDGSTDSSIDIIEGYLANDKRFRLYKRNKNSKGAQTCRNIGMDNARGKYLIFLDSDDLLAPYCLSNRVKFMNENPLLDFAVYQVITFNKYPGDTNILWNIFTEEEDLFRFFNDDAPWQTSSPIWNKEFVNKLRWDESCISGQDWDFHVHALSFKPAYVKDKGIPDCFIRRDISVERISKNFYKGPQIMNRQKMWLKNYKLLKEKGLWKKQYNLPLASFYFRFCELFLLKLRDPKFHAWTFYSTVYRENLLDLVTFLRTSFYLMGLFWLRNNRFVFKQFYHFVSPLMPGNMRLDNFYKTQEKMKLEGELLEILTQANKKPLIL